ncbi:MAG: IPT/TIG domain-containing protein, partial [Candidatus Poribacteria bacterium]|nr:IPT/TIG domain-containing protein [Candidatus Poribacteria bacterium]
MMKRTTAALWSAPLVLLVAGALGCNPTPVVTGISPSSGPETGGNSVTLTGEKFKEGAQVAFGSALLPATVTSKTTLTVTAPAHEVGTVQVTVVNPKEKRALESMNYTYLDTTPPTVQGVTPADGTTFVQGTDYTDAVATGLNTITVTYSEPLKSGSISVTVASAADALKKDVEGVVAGTSTVSGNTITFVAETDFLSARTYTFTVDGAADEAGNAAAATSASFTVATPTRVHWYTV